VDAFNCDQGVRGYGLVLYEHQRWYYHVTLVLTLWLRGIRLGSITTRTCEMPKALGTMLARPAGAAGAQHATVLFTRTGYCAYSASTTRRSKRAQ
jgi:hypothetical protein